MTHEQLKDAVVEAAQTLMDGGGGPKYHANWNVLAIALSDYRASAALDAHTEAETVTLGLMRGRGRLSDRWHASQEPEQEDPRDWQHVGNISFVPPPEPTIPTISATVTREGGP